MVSAFMYLSILCIFIIIASDVPLKGYLSGFWYTDPRIAASCVIMVKRHERTKTRCA